jgi:hypothetical protein
LSVEIATSIDERARYAHALDAGATAAEMRAVPVARALIGIRIEKKGAGGEERDTCSDPDDASNTYSHWIPLAVASYAPTT